MPKRKVQEIFDALREADNLENDANEALENLKHDTMTLQIQLEETKKQKLLLEEELKGAQKDLIKEKKIKFVAMTLEEYLKLENDQLKFYVYTVEGHRQFGIMEGEDKLNEEDTEHFEEYKRDYFYHGQPMYIDRNHPNSEMTECELSFEGDVHLTEHHAWSF